MEELCNDMEKVREEELALVAAEASQQILFKLPDSENAAVHALRSIVAVRGFGGKLLGGKGSAALAAPPAEGEDMPPEAPAEKGMPEVELPGVTEAALKLLLGFMYTSRLAVTDENWHEILPAADKLGVEGAKKAVEQHFSQPGKLIASNAASVLALAEKHHAAGLKSLCIACIEADWAGCTSAETFSQLPKETIQALLASDTIRAPELAIFHATIAWGKAQLKAASPPAEEAPAEGEDAAAAAAAAPKQNGLENVLDGVIDLVRFPLISPEDLRDAVQPALKEEKYGAAERLVLEGYQYHALVKIGQPHNLDPAKTRPRGSPPTASQANRKEAAGAAAGNASPPSGPDQAAVGDAILRANRTSRWLGSLPQGVERVSMAGMRLGEDDAIVLADFLQKRGRPLLELDLKCNQLTCTALRRILPSLSNCVHLTGLALGDNPIGEAGGECIAEVLAQLPGLQKLGMGGTGLGDAGLAQLAGAVASHPAMRVVGLSGNGVSKAGALAFITALGACSVESVVLTGNGFTPQDAEELQAACRQGMAVRVA